MPDEVSEISAFSRLRNAERSPHAVIGREPLEVARQRTVLG
jgi:hypothetical protein